MIEEENNGKVCYSVASKVDEEVEKLNSEYNEDDSGKTRNEGVGLWVLL